MKKTIALLLLTAILLPLVACQGGGAPMNDSTQDVTDVKDDNTTLPPEDGEPSVDENPLYEFSSTGGCIDSVHFKPAAMESTEPFVVEFPKTLNGFTVRQITFLTSPIPKIILGEDFEENIDAPMKAREETGKITSDDYLVFLNSWSKINLNEMRKFLQIAYLEKYPFLKKLAWEENGETVYPVVYVFNDDTVSYARRLEIEAYLKELGYTGQSAYTYAKNAVYNSDIEDKDAAWAEVAPIFCDFLPDNVVGVRFPETLTSLSISIFPFAEWENGVAYIDHWAVAYDEEIVGDDLIIRDGTVGLRNGFFSDSRITSLTLPSSLKKWGTNPFSGSHLLTDVYYQGTLSDWCAFDFVNENSNPMKYAKNLYLNGALISGELIIPEDIEHIGSYTFYSMDKITSVTAHAKSIGAYAFAGCESLTSVKLANEAETIGESAFSGCAALTNVDIPNGVKTIGESAFENCSALVSIDLPNGLTKINHGTFSHCTSLASIDIPDSVTWIGGSVFSNCRALTSVDLPDHLTMIGGYTFSNCIGIKEIVIPEGVTGLVGGTFENCTNLLSVTLPKQMISIGFNAFANCVNLSNITIPDSVTRIDSHAFQNCEKISSVMLPGALSYLGASVFSGTAVSFELEDGVSYLGEWAVGCDEMISHAALREGTVGISEDAFVGCSLMSDVTLPISVRYIGDVAFKDCENLMNVHISDIDAWCRIDFGIDLLYNNPLAYADYLYVDEKLVKDVVIPEGVTSISHHAFSFTHLESIVLPEGIEAIGEYAFEDCNQLKAINIPASVKRICEGAFELDLEFIDGKPVYNDSLESVYISDVAAWCNIRYDDHLYNPYPMKFAEKLYVNGELVTHITIPEGITTLPPYAFSCENLKSITIPTSITYLDRYAFLNADQLLEVVDGVSYIDNWVIQAVTDLETLVIRDGTVGIGRNAIYGESLKTIVFPASLRTICSGAIEYCENLKNVELPMGVTYIGENAFAQSHSAVENENGAIYIDHWMLDVRSSDVIVRNGTVGIASIDLTSDYTETNGIGVKITIPKSVKYIGTLNWPYLYEGVAAPDAENAIYYEGTCAEWKAIDLKEMICYGVYYSFSESTTFENVLVDINEQAPRLITVYCSDGEIYYPER